MYFTYAQKIYNNEAKTPKKKKTVLLKVAICLCNNVNKIMQSDFTEGKWTKPHSNKFYLERAPFKQIHTEDNQFQA